jgi:hypothetical protein
MDAKWCIGQSNLLKVPPDPPTAFYYTHKDAAGKEYKACALKCDEIENWKVDGKVIGGFSTTKAGTDYVRR